jgi:hypothetical protein
VFVPVLVTAAPFYTWTLLTTGSLTGEQHDVAAGLFADAKGLMAVTQVRWLQAADSTFMSYVWIGNWSFLQVRSWMYHAVAVLYALAAWRAFPAMLARRQLLLLGGLIAALLAGIAYHVLVTFRVHGISSSTGWYLHVLVTAEAILLAWGWRGFVGIVAGVFVAIDMFGTWAYLLPYYAGYIAHTADGRLAAYPVLARLETVPAILERVAPAGFALPLLGLHVTVLTGMLWLAMYQWRRQ